MFFHSCIITQGLQIVKRKITNNYKIFYRCLHWFQLSLSPVTAAPLFFPYYTGFPPHFATVSETKSIIPLPHGMLHFPGSRLQKAVTGCHPERAGEPKDLRTYPLYALHTEAECEDSSIALRSSRNDTLFSGLMICQIWIRIANCYQRYCIFSTGMV